MNIAGVLQQTAQETPDSEALVSLREPEARGAVAYAELWQRCQSIAGHLLEMNCIPGDRVALLLHNSIEYVESFFAVASAALVAVPLNVRLLEAEHRFMLVDSGARVLIVHADLLADRPSLLSRPIPGLQVVVVGEDVHGAIPYLHLFGSPSHEPSQLDPQSPASIMYTSGTTGPPKGVVLSHHSWQCVAELATRYLEMEPGPRTIHAAPLTHGAGFLLLPTIRQHGTNVVCPFEPRALLDVLQEEAITHGFFVPAMIQMLLDEIEHSAWVTPPTLKSLYYAGSPISQGTLLRALECFGPILVQSYAQMESPMFATVLDKRDHARIRSGVSVERASSSGRPCDGIDVRILDDNGQDVPTGAEGEIALRAPQVMTGYWNRPDASAEVQRGPWLHTGDVGRLDESGYLFVTDRKKDMIISGGSNVYAREVEDVISAVPGVREVAVIGLPHRKWGEAVVAVVVKDDDIGEDELDAICRTGLADYRRPKRWIWRDGLPRNSYGKLLKVELRRELRDLFADAS